VLTPTVLSAFYTEYNGNPVPADEHFQNVLERRFSVPRTRTGEAIKLIIENARFAGILEERPGGEQPIIRIGGARAAAPLPEGLPTATPAPDDDGTQAEAGDWDSVCFYITPLGDDGTEFRKHADMLLKHLVDPVIKELGLKVVRADRIERSGLITRQIFEHLAKARLCVVDLSFSNPNVFYELGVRHVCKLPAVQIIRKGDKIPFDVSQGRTIIIDTGDVYTVMDRLESARRELAEHVRAILASSPSEPADDNPVHVYLPDLRVTLPR
jgi:hypothetical protein